MRKYGVCLWNEDNDTIDELKAIFDTYEKACEYYKNNFAYISPPRNLWVVYIENNKIVQFEQFIRHARSKNIPLSEEIINGTENET